MDLEKFWLSSEKICTQWDHGDNWVHNTNNSCHTCILLWRCERWKYQIRVNICLDLDLEMLRFRDLDI